MKALPPTQPAAPWDTVPSAGPALLVDQFGRYKHKLRISLTDRCNFRCSYCMPDQPDWLPKSAILNFEQLISLASVMVSLGIQHIRLTGGEPLMRKGIVHFVEQLNRLKAMGLQRISLTTNAYYLARYANALRQAGLDDVNISVDSIHPATFFSMTQRPLQPVLSGIAAAQRAGLPVKLNCVLVAGQNDDQIVQLTQWAYDRHLPLRFIEYMPLDSPKQWQRNKVITEETVITRLQPFFSIRPLARTSQPATLYRLNERYDLGIISTVSKPFCHTCDRLRLTATGELFTCLFASAGTPLKPFLAPPGKAPHDNVQPGNAQPDIAQPDIAQPRLIQAILHAVWHKKSGFIDNASAPLRKITMHALGG